MPEDKRRRQVIKHYCKEYTCDECGEGKMELACNVYGYGDIGCLTVTRHTYSDNNGTHYPHQCTNCGHERVFTNISYPHEYEVRKFVKTK